MPAMKAVKVETLCGGTYNGLRPRRRDDRNRLRIKKKYSKHFARVEIYEGRHSCPRQIARFHIDTSAFSNIGSYLCTNGSNFLVIHCQLDESFLSLKHFASEMMCNKQDSLAAFPIRLKNAAQCFCQRRVPRVFTRRSSKGLGTRLCMSKVTWTCTTSVTMSMFGKVTMSMFQSYEKIVSNSYWLTVFPREA